MKYRLKKLYPFISDNPLKRMLISYILFLCIYIFFHIGYGAVNLFGYTTGKYSEKNLVLGDFEIIDGEITDEMTLSNKSNDTQLIYTGNIRSLIIKCSFSENPGEFICFYNSSGDYVFGTHKMEYAKIYDGYYFFEFPLGTKQIRLDTGIFPTTITFFDEMVLNRPSVSTIFNITTGDIFSLLVLPGACFMIVETALPTIKKMKIIKK